MNHLRQRISELMAQANVVGLSVALIQDGEIAWREGFGLKRLDTREPVTIDTVFEAASLSKPVFAYAALKLCEDGVLDLDAPLGRYLPEPYLDDDPRLDLITARHVLSHTCGFPNWRSKGEPLRIHFAPGGRWSYSGEGFVYLQKVIERVTGESLTDFTRARLLEPFGMASSSYVWLDDYKALAAQGYKDGNEPAHKMKPAEPNAAYTLQTTPTDFARFMLAVMRPPAPDRFHLRAETVAALLTPQSQVTDMAPWHDDWPDGAFLPFEAVYWGLGWGLQRSDAGDGFWHWGDNGAFQAFALGCTAHGTGLVAMSNTESARRIWGPLFAEALSGPHSALDWLARVYGEA